MIPKLCALHGKQVAEKRVSLYWAWQNAQNRRSAFLQQVCADCFRQEYARLIVAAEEPVLLCPMCGIDTVDDYQAIWLTYCVPGMPKAQSEMPMCPPHGDQLRNTAMTGASRLEDREASSGGLGPQPEALTGSALWDALGLHPTRRGG
jgi:hypothetical protein